MTRKNKVLIIDDDPSAIRFVMRILLQAKSYDLTSAETGKKAVEILGKKDSFFDIALIDQMLPDSSGLELLRIIKGKYPRTECVMLTAVDDIDVAVAAIKLGAYDYLKKPVDPSKLVLTLNHIVEKEDLLTRLESLKDKSSPRRHHEAFREIITRSPKMSALFDQVESTALTDDPILICGESGTGKELFARSIHEIKFGKSRPFSGVNISSYQNELFANELFGHAKGAYTGAQTESDGLIGATGSGTLFLDEIGDLDLAVQSRLLRVLENKEYYRVGDSRIKNVHCRFIFATNKNLFQLMETGQFRKDLYFRISAHIIEIPPLRERREDITLLAGAFLVRFSERNRKKMTSISNDVLEFLNRYNFPGNVRELENIIKSAAAVEQKKTVTKKSLPQYLQKYFQEENRDKLLTLEEAEKKHILFVLNALNSNNSHTARALGISRPTLIKKLKGIKKNG
jgi:DNA-binding NtrC family response regulator